MTTPDINGWIIASVLVLIAAAVAGLLIFTAAVFRVRRRPHPPILWLLLLMVALMSCFTLVEQLRVLIFRLTDDGLIAQAWFSHLFRSSLDLVVFKLLGAVALTIGATVKFSLIRGHDDDAAIRCLWHAMLILGATYLGLAVVLEIIFP